VDGQRGVDGFLNYLSDQDLLRFRLSLSSCISCHQNFVEDLLDSRFHLVPIFLTLAVLLGCNR
jgi:hypothetical protein